MFTVWCGMLHHLQKRSRLSSACGAQAPELLFPLKSLKFCHWWFTLSIISLKWLSYLSYFAPFFFFFESLPYTQAGISAVCYVILSSRMLFGKTENKTKWINLQIKKKQWKPKPKQTTKIQPVQLTTQTVAVSFAWKWPQSRGKQEKEFSVSHVSYFTPKNIKYESIKI